MARSLRNTDPELIHLITVRVNEAALWMIPSYVVNEIIGGVVARYQEILGIILYCYSFQSNHYHLMAQAPRGNLDEFEENINREIARRINRLHRRRAKFWSRRYDDQIVVTDADAMAAFLYVTTNPVKHRLVENASEWPGLNSYEQSLSGKSKTYSFVHYSKRNKRGIPIKTRHSLKVSPLPVYASISPVERRKILIRQIAAHTCSLKEKAQQQGKSFLGRRGVITQIAGSTPAEISFARRRACYSISDQARRSFQLAERERHIRYSEASHRYRLGDLHVQFPSFSFRPPLHRVPRSQPFKQLERLTA